MPHWSSCKTFFIIMKQDYKSKLTIFIPTLLFLLGICVFTFHMWNMCIETGTCSSGVVHYYYRPLFYASVSLLTFFTLFLFLPFRYFKKWLIWIFSWGIIVSFIGVLSHLDSPSVGPASPFATREIIILQTIFFWILTLIFCAILWWRERKQRSTSKSME